MGNGLVNFEPCSPKEYTMKIIMGSKLVFSQMYTVNNHWEYYTFVDENLCHFTISKSLWLKRNVLMPLNIMAWTPGCHKIGRMSSDCGYTVKLRNNAECLCSNWTQFLGSNETFVDTRHVVLINTLKVSGNDCMYINIQGKGFGTSGRF